ncbi:MAG: hypothetical protein HY292_02965 [Planctomycetes bacterium]|nr:hypothetical protein [Planctomycetota bacterium]
MSDPEITRRGFLKTTGVAVTPLLFRPAISFVRPPLQAAPADKGLSPEWLKSLSDTKPIVYRGAALEHVAFPLGGVGTGSVCLGGRGDLVEWQIFNNVDKRAKVPDSFFAVKVGTETRRLVQGDRDGARGFADAELRAEYPIARLSLRNASLPIECEVEAWNPMIPLDSKRSAMPVAIFHLRAKNWSAVVQDVTFVASLRNAIGYDGHGAITPGEGKFAGFRGNVNRVVREDGLTAIEMTSAPFSPAKLDQALRLYVLGAAVEWGRYERPSNVTIEMDGGKLPSADDLRARFDLVWMNGSSRWPLGSDEIQSLVEFVGRGGNLVLSGTANPLLRAMDASADEGATPGRQTTIADFESGTYDGWTVEGSAFGTSPATGKIAWQNPVSGWQGKFFVNSFAGDDGPTGTMRSKPFEIVERFFLFRIGGGGHVGATCLNLVVDGRVVRSATGQNTETLEAVAWDVSAWRGKQATLEIVDRASGGWGHVLVDDVRLSSAPVFEMPLPKSERDALAALLKDGEAHGVLVVRDEILAPGVDTDHSSIHWLMLAATTGRTYTLSLGRDDDDPLFGSMALATSSSGARSETGHGTGVERRSPIGTLEASLTVPPGDVREATFVIAWHFPNREYGGARVGNEYATRFHSALEAARVALRDLVALRDETRRYRDAMTDSTLPTCVVDAVTSQASIVRSQTYMWLEDGHIAAFEGCGDGEGCCPMNCTHVYDYVQSVAKLFPDLERDVRRLDLEHQQDADGGVHHRIPVPIQATPGGPGPAADGQCGTVLKTYREHLQSADGKFLEALWPRAKRALEWIVANLDRDEDGVLEGAQFNTYDQNVTGPNPFVGSLYLAALRAGEEMAKLRGDADAARYRGLFDKGSAFTGERLWNGEYFVQMNGPEIGPGCFADQLLGQWWAHLLGLGYVLPKERVQTALRSIFKYNFLPTHESWHHRQRVFADGKDKGLLCCSWPKGGRPANPILYCDEVWTGVEYQVASHMLFEGIVEEGLAIVKGARDRYDGTKRNPWNEIECGDHYARAMSSFALLTAAQGSTYDGPAGVIGFAPRLSPEKHRSFFVGAEGWGQFEQTRAELELRATLTVKWGSLALREVRLQAPWPAREATVRAPWGESRVAVAPAGEWLRVPLGEHRRIVAGETLSIVIRAS